MHGEDTAKILPRRIDRPRRHEILFSICTLVSNRKLYEQMCESFRLGGFSGGDVEYLYIDNTAGNTFDAYAGLNCLISHARGRYLILCHQDVVLLDAGRPELVERLGELDRLDPAWALAGNAGGDDRGRSIMHFSDRFGVEHKTDNLPALARSLDENFIILRNGCQLGFSNDLEGFHLYGTDICLQAEARGWAAYVLDFHLRHDGEGTMDESFWICRSNLEKKYGDFFQTRRIRTTCTIVLLAPSRLARASKRRLQALRWYRRAIWKWMRGKPIPPRD